MKTSKMWRCKMCGDLFPNDDSPAILDHFTAKHPNHDVVDIMDNKIELVEGDQTMRELKTIKDGMCLILANIVGMDVIIKNGKFCKTNLKGLEEEITMEEILEAKQWN